MLKQVSVQEITFMDGMGNLKMNTIQKKKPFMDTSETT